MPDHSMTTLTRIILATVLLLPVYTQAQSDQWYQVELLVFSRPAGATAERWDPIPDLDYPSRHQFLSYPGEEQTSLSGTSVPDSTVNNSADNSADSGTPASDNAQPSPALPKAFTALPASQRQFSGKAAAMQRSGRYRILFHEAWIQPMNAKGQALPIILDRSGDGGPWPALQGSIKLYQSRFAYLDTNLWLNTQGEYLPGTWSMPAPPLAPASKPQQVTVYSKPDQPAATPRAEPENRTAAASEGQIEPGMDSGELQYPFRHAVLLEQTRRLRSGEIVYIDHPLLGVLVTITPLAPAEG
jgi:peptidoglycan-binding protein CsiV